METLFFVLVVVFLLFLEALDLTLLLDVDVAADFFAVVFLFFGAGDDPLTFLTFDFTEPFLVEDLLPLVLLLLLLLLLRLRFVAAFFTDGSAPFAVAAVVDFVDDLELAAFRARGAGEPPLPPLFNNCRPPVVNRKD